MLENELKKLNNAYEVYNSDIDENIVSKILKFTRERMIANKDLYEELIEEKKDEISFDSLVDIFDENASNKSLFKKNKKINMFNDGFISGMYISSIGNIVVETTNIKDVLKYFVLSVISRNTITISDLNYNELDTKHFIMEIFKKSFEKYNLDNNYFLILPFEECNYKMFDLYINTESGEKKYKKETDTLFLYDDSSFEKEVQNEINYLISNNKKYEILKGNLEKAINKINKYIPDAAVIFTKNQEMAYRFIIGVHAKNVFVNTSFSKVDYDLKADESSLYRNKKIMYQLYDQEIVENLDNNKKEKSVEEIKEEKEKNNDIDIIKKENIITKLIRIIKSIFKK